MTTRHLWQFRSRFRRGAFGWRGSGKAIERLNEALSEILLVARMDASLAAEGAVILLTKVSSALQDDLLESRRRLLERAVCRRPAR